MHFETDFVSRGKGYKWEVVFSFTFIFLANIKIQNQQQSYAAEPIVVSTSACTFMCMYLHKVSWSKPIPVSMYALYTQDICTRSTPSQKLPYVDWWATVHAPKHNTATLTHTHKKEGDRECCFLYSFWAMLTILVTKC